MILDGAKAAKLPKSYINRLRKIPTVGKASKNWQSYVKKVEDLEKRTRDLLSDKEYIIWKKEQNHLAKIEYYKELRESELSIGKKIRRSLSFSL